MRRPASVGGLAFLIGLLHPSRGVSAPSEDFLLRVAERVGAISDELWQRQIFVFAVGVVLFFVAIAAVWAASRRWVVLPVSQWLVVLLVPMLAAVAVAHTLDATLAANVDTVTRQSLDDLERSRLVLERPGLLQDIWKIRSLQDAVDAGRRAMILRIVGTPLVNLLGLSCTGLLLLWLITNYRAVEGRYAGRPGGVG